MWSKRFSECVKCGTDTIPHMAKGKCRRCYLSEYNATPKNKKRIRAAKDKWYRRNVTPESRRIDREQRNYGGRRQAILKRDRHRCVRCGSRDSLTVHHKDGKGRGVPTPNNADSNLETLCRPCHARVHHTCTGWARDYDSCQKCGTTERKHNAKGLCWKCYDRATRG